MPVAAARLPDVLGRDPNPSVSLRRDDHRLQQATVGLLDLASPPELGLRLAEPHGEAIADSLELARVEHSGSAHRRHPPLDSLAGKGGCEELAETLFEQCDLAPEVVTDAALGEEVDFREGIADDPLGLSQLLCHFDRGQLVGHEPSFSRGSTGPIVTSSGLTGEPISARGLEMIDSTATRVIQVRDVVESLI
jgi:hypothetical protein